jgi:predicted MFS family arabinose efflux permease
MLGRYILRYGGLRVTLLSFVVEAAGLVLLWLAPVPFAAMIGAGVTGFGFAPIFPALGVEAVSRVPPQNRGAAIGLYSVFLDVSLGITGPVAGLLIQRFGSASPFWLAAGASIVGIAVTGALLSR